MESASARPQVHGSASREAVSLDYTAEAREAAGRRLDLREAMTRGGVVEIRMSLPRRLHVQLTALMSAANINQQDALIALVEEGLAGHLEEIRECLGL